MTIKHTTALIIDDEPPARKQMRRLLTAHPDIEIVAEAGRLADAKKAVAETAPDLVFLDIQLYDKSGFDLLGDLPEKTAVIFVTAFDRYAIRAFEVNALDYLLKPVTPERLAVALARREPPPVVSLAEDDRVYLKLGRKRWFEPVENILAVRADGDHSGVWLADGQRVTVRRSLSEWESILPAGHFLRIHRNSIVNLAAIRETDQLEGGGLCVTLNGAEEPLEASRRRVPELRRLLKGFQGTEER